MITLFSLVKSVIMHRLQSSSRLEIVSLIMHRFLLEVNTDSLADWRKHFVKSAYLTMIQSFCLKRAGGETKYSHSVKQLKELLMCWILKRKLCSTSTSLLSGHLLCNLNMWGFWPLFLLPVQTYTQTQTAAAQTLELKSNMIQHPWLNASFSKNSSCPLPPSPVVKS